MHSLPCNYDCLFTSQNPYSTSNFHYSRCTVTYAWSDLHYKICMLRCLATVHSKFTMHFGQGPSHGISMFILSTNCSGKHPNGLTIFVLLGYAEKGSTEWRYMTGTAWRYNANYLHSQHSCCSHLAWPNLLLGWQYLSVSASSQLVSSLGTSDYMHIKISCSQATSPPQSWRQTWSP